MVSLRFPFSSFSQPSNPPNPSRHFSPTTVAFAVVAATVGAVSCAGIAASQNHKDSKNRFLQSALDFFFSNNSLPLFGSLSLADSSPVVESKTGVSFPAILGELQRLLGIGVRRKNILGLKSIDVYAFGVYADYNNIKNLLGDKYGKLSISELEKSKELNVDIMESDITMTVRLQIVYSKLKMRSVRGSFEESVGSRLQKFGEPNQKELLHRFTSQFRDEHKLPRGTVIEISRERGNVLCTRIDGELVGSIQSNLLCRSILDLYIGDDPVDHKAKEEFKHNLASLLHD